jgi:hypothetical protein
MTNQPDDPVRARLTAHDPLKRQPHLHPAEPPAHLLEQIMNTPTIITDESTSAPPTAPSRHRARRWIFGGAGLGTAAAVAGILAVTGGNPATPTAVQLGIGAEDLMASCMPVSADVLDDMPIAFAATAVSVEGEIVTLDVTQWFVGGDSDQVILTATAGMEALIGGIEFEPGGTYLVSATDGVVNFCGYTGAATPELQAVYDAAFPS